MLGGRIFKNALSLGCGQGLTDRTFAGYGLFERHLGLDISQGALDVAHTLAADNRLTYLAADLNLGLPEGASGPFDLVYAVASLHHIANLERLLDDVHDRMTDDGLLMFYEYCGPNQLQWRPETIELSNRLLALLPESLTRGRVARPVCLAEIARTDPSEAARSEEIMALVGERFRILHEVDVGHTLTQPMLSPILANFDDANELHQAICKLVFEFEAILIDSGAVPSDTKFVVAAKLSA